MKAKLLFFCLFLFLTCKSAKEAFNDGNYEAAFKKALKEIKDGKDVRQNKILMNRSLTKLTDEANTNYKNTKKTNLSGLEKSYDKLIKLEDYFEKGQAYLDSTSNINFSRTKQLRKTVNDEIVDYLYDNGQKELSFAMSRDDKLSAQKAHQSFTKIKFKYDNNLADLDSLIDVSYKRAITIFQFYADVSFNLWERSKVEQKFDDLTTTGNSNYQIIHFGQHYNQNADCVVELDFSQLQENDRRQSERRKFEKQIEDGYTTKTDENGNVIKVPKYKTIVGYVDINTTRYELSWNISADVRSNSRHCKFYDNNFSSTAFQVIEKYEISGDRNAIPNQYLSSSNNRYDRDRLLDQLLNDLYSKVRNYYF